MNRFIVHRLFPVAAVLLLLAAGQVTSLSLDTDTARRFARTKTGVAAARKQCYDNKVIYNVSQQQNISRRSLAQKVSAAVSFSVLVASHLSQPPKPAWASSTNNNDLTDLKATVQQARGQLDPVTGIIEKQQWDKVRAILITPPLSDFWTTTKKGRNVLMDVAAAVGDAGGDEFNILELREEAQSHLRYLDMAVYNNVFNPIGTEGTTGATKELVRSYYEDPKNELKAVLSALDGILKEISGAGG